MKSFHFYLLLVLATSNFFVISDLHYDIAYQGNYNSSFICHSVGFYTSDIWPVPTNDVQNFSRPFCDSSMELLESAVAEMFQIDENPEFILLTGDIVAHYTSALLKENKEFDPVYNIQLVQESFEDVSDLLLKYFPGTLIIPMIGNNDGYVDYEMPTGLIKIQYLDFLYSVWNPLVKNIPYTFFTDGYFSCKTASGFNVIALNSDFFSVNFDGSMIHGFSELMWLRAQLQINDRNLITMHIPPGLGLYGGGKMSMIEIFSDSLVDIINEYSSKISAVFGGHYHNGAFQIIGSTSMFLTPSISPFFGNNPGFRYYKSDLTDYTQYNIDGYNITGNWKSFTYTSRYGYSINDTRLYQDLKSGKVDLWYYLKGISGLWIDSESSDSLACQIIFGKKICSQGEEIVKQVLLCQIVNQSLSKFNTCMSSFSTE
jgi:sphingomyelin phosphodiesterase acid-like 3